MCRPRPPRATLLVMVPNKRTIKCETCGRDATLEVVADGFDDEPPSFVITRTCSGHRQPKYAPLSAQEMHERTGVALTGWSREAEEINTLVGAYKSGFAKLASMG